MSAASPHFLLVDDHALFRTGLGMMLSQNWPQSRVTQATTLTQARAVLAQEQPDLILLDVHLPDGHSLMDLPTLRALAPDCPVLMMSAEVNGQQILQARQAGVTGFLPKVASASEVLEAVRSALGGQMSYAAVPYEVLSQAGGEGDTPAAVMEVAEAELRLNDRQLNILRYLGRGTPNKAIARQMGMNESEVRAEVSWLTEWLGATSREQAHAEAVARGLLQP
ncbi:MAG: response regulator transcription factor [Aquabacterium sp.]|uniref:response regulator transcription factor n=1 Tax=Aquabacterium sp. TaxID=1872578 RepID=UPI0025BB059A|nr:response regulator transcription factor [Aquabacterium sp.]MBI5926559.1 response regulator transcription factor [Aquabacterium sp.]